MLEDPINLSYYTRGTASNAFNIAKLVSPTSNQSNYYTQTFHASGRLNYRDDYLFRFQEQSDGLIRPGMSVKRTKYDDVDGAEGWTAFVSSLGFTFQPNFDTDDLVAALARSRMLCGWLGDESANANLLRLANREL